MRGLAHWLLLALLFPVGASAQSGAAASESPPIEGASVASGHASGERTREHERFFFRLSTSPGVTGLASPDVQLAGKSLGVAVQLGLHTPSGWIVHLGFAGPLLRPDIRQGESTLGGTIERAFAIGLSGGVTRYLGTKNRFVTLLATGSSLHLEGSLDDAGAEGNVIELTQVGAVVEAQYGREWWVSPDWAIGVGASGHLGSFRSGSWARRSEQEPTRYWLGGVGAVITATFD